MAKLIIDVSSWQRTIDWAKVSATVDGAIIRMGYGDDYKSQDDPYFEYNYAQCKKYNIPVGCYLYSYATTNAQSELAHVRRLMKGKTFELGFWFDAEQNGTQSYAKKCAEYVCDGVKADGHRVGVYASTSWWDSCLYTLTRFPRWIAQYYHQCTCKFDKVMWQYTSDGVVNGVSGRCDLSYLYDDSWLKIESESVKEPSKTTTTAKVVKSLKPTSKTKFCVSKSTTPNKKTRKFKATTTCASNLRMWAGTYSRRLRTIPKNTTVYVYDAILDKSGNAWYYIKYDGSFYFISKSLVKYKA